MVPDHTALPEGHHVEVDQQAELEGTRLEIGEELRHVNRQERRHGLELHHELGTYDEVESRLCNAQALVPNRNRHLPPERDPLEAKLHDESFFVDRFEEARPRWR